MECTRRQKGQSLVEFVLILPFLLILLSGLLDIGRLYYAYVAVTDAAGEGVAYAAIHPDETNEILQRARTASGGLVTSDDLSVQLSQPASLVSGAPITVTVDYTFTVLTPFVNTVVPGGALPLRAVATEVIVPGELSE